MGLTDFISSKINDEIGDYLRQAKVDPLEVMFKGSQPLGEIDLGVPVTARLDYSVGQVTGLSSLAVKPKIQLGSVDWEQLIAGKHPEIEGSFSASGQFQTVAAKLHGALEASFEGASPRVDLDGSLSIEGLAAVLEGTLTITGEGSLTKGIKVCVTSLDVKKLGLTHEAVHIQFEDLGVFGHLLDHVVAVIDGHVGKVIERGLDSVLKSAANGGIKSLLPFCEQFHPFEEAGKGLLDKLGDWFGG